MTCIATDGKSMAADGYMMDSGIIVSRANSKIERFPDGRIFGAGGDAAGGQLIRDWLLKPCDEDGRRAMFPDIDEETSAIVLNTDGTVDLYDHTGFGEAIRVETPMAIGSGMEIALGAMDAGASPIQAVKIASQRVPSVGGTLECLTLEVE